MRTKSRSKCTSHTIQTILLISITITTLSICYLNLHISNLPSNTALQAPHTVNTKLKINAEPSAQLLLHHALTPRPLPDDTINPTLESERCRKYHFNYTGRTTRRRIFFGSLIADDPWSTLAMGAIEHYGVFHSVAFVESNRTQNFNARNVRFGKDSDSYKVLQKLYGPTKVTVDQYVNEDSSLLSLGREHAQRSLIIKRWKADGMKGGDIGLLADVDEVPSRDFVRALQICEVREFDSHGNCREPKVDAGSVVFEGAPGCLRLGRWFRPFFILGECIQGISNSTSHPTPQRTWSGLGWMDDGYTKKSKFSSLPPQSTHYPLWNAADIRHHPGKSYGYEWSLYTGYHFHNFFPDVKTLRKKYKTYGHAVEGAMGMSLGDIHEDLRVMLYCVLEGNKSKAESEKLGLVEGGLDYFGRPFVPLAFGVEGYVEMRRRELRKILLGDLKGDGVN